MMPRTDLLVVPVKPPPAPDLRTQVRQFIISNFYVARPDQLANSTSLMDTGIMDSTGVLELMSFLETTFAIKVADQELLPENFDSVDRITTYLTGKLGV